MSSDAIKNLIVGIALVCVVTFVSCFTDACNVGDGDMRRICAAEGLVDCKVTGRAFFQCSEDDAFASSFTAKRGGRAVEGTVCCGLFKDCTVRW